MAFELDHVFIFTAADASAVDTLVDHGFQEGSTNIHPGQGTRNRRFFFRNVMLEALWVHDESEARNSRTAPTRLYERWLNRAAGACPFGFCLRPVDAHSGNRPFAGWAYRPSYLPPDFSIHVADDCEDIRQPFLFYLPFHSRAGYPPANEPVHHSADIEILSDIELSLPNTVTPSPALQTLIDSSILKLRSSSDYNLRITFDQARQGKNLDLHPHLPLMIRY